MQKPNCAVATYGTGTYRYCAMSTGMYCTACWSRARRVSCTIYPLLCTMDTYLDFLSGVVAVGFTTGNVLSHSGHPLVFVSFPKHFQFKENHFIFCQLRLSASFNFFQKNVLPHSGHPFVFVYFPKHCQFKENCFIFCWLRLSVSFDFNRCSIGWGSFCSSMYTFWESMYTFREP